MTLTLSKPSEGDVGWSAAVNQNWTDIEDSINQGTGYPKGYVDGLRLRYSSATAIVVEAGSCRDKDNAGNLTLASEATVSVASTGALGLDTKTLTATVSTTSGTSNATASSSILSEIGTRVLTGTISSSGTTVTGTGSSTRFLSEVAVGDLIGTATTYGFARVTAIASDTSLTIAAALPGGNAPASTAASVVENAVLRFELTAPVNKRINTLSAAGTAIVADSTFSATESGKVLKVSAEVASCWFAVWVAEGGSGATTLLSTQRTSAYLPSGYDTRSRRIGWVRNLSTGDFMEFQQTALGRVRHTSFEVSYGGYARVLANGNATSWTDVDCSGVVPPTSLLAEANLWLYNTSNGPVLSVRPRGVGSSSTNRPRMTYQSTYGGSSTNTVRAPLDGAQVMQYALTVSDMNTPAFIDLSGYEEQL